MVADDELGESERRTKVPRAALDACAQPLPPLLLPPRAIWRANARRWPPRSSRPGSSTVRPRSLAQLR